VERYVRCPRGGLVPLRQCDACELMQGTLWGDQLEVLCAYPEPAPALSLSHAAGGMHGSQGSPAALAAGQGRDPALALAAQPTARRAQAVPASALIFESDWPDDD
jgi:hypothetical protein